MAHDKIYILWQKYAVMHFALYRDLHTIFDFPSLFYFYTIMHFSLFTVTCTLSCIFPCLPWLVHCHAFSWFTVTNTLSCIFIVYCDQYTVMHFPGLLWPIHCHAFSWFTMTHTLSCIFLVYHDSHIVMHFSVLQWQVLGLVLLSDAEVKQRQDWYYTRYVMFKGAVAGTSHSDGLSRADL